MSRLRYMLYNTEKFNRRTAILPTVEDLSTHSRVKMS